MKVTAELSTCVKSVRFNSTLCTPLATNFCRLLRNNSLSLASIDLPRRSRMVTSPDSRVEISRSTTHPCVKFVVPWLRVPAQDYTPAAIRPYLRSVTSQVACVMRVPRSVQIARPFKLSLPSPFHFREASAGVSGLVSPKVSLANAARLPAAGFSSAVSHRNARG